MKKTPFEGRILMVGFGSVGRCTLPLLLRHLDMPAERIAIVDGEDHGAALAPWRDSGVRYAVEPIVAVRTGSTSVTSTRTAFPWETRRSSWSPASPARLASWL